jgi:hypothetical protein
MQYKIKIRRADGTFREAQSMDDIQAGETAIIEPTVPAPENTVIEDNELVLRMAAFFGMKASDFIEGAAKAFGIPPCAVCQLTKQVLYSIKQLGVLRSTVFLMKTFAARFGAVESERIKAELEKALAEGDAR